MEEVIQVVTTVGTRDDAWRLARHVVEARLGACVQVVGPIHSTYWWEGAIEEAEEWMCAIKSVRDAYGQLEEAILEVHPYEVPEVLAFPVVDGHRPYVEWLTETMGRG